MKRLVSLSDGISMGNTLFIFETDAPVEKLKALEKASNEVYLNGGDDDDVPIWSNVLERKGYVFDYVDEHRHVTPYGTSKDWLDSNYAQITEHYEIQSY